MTTPVIFRKFKNDKSIIALFPCEAGTNDPYTCNSYQHIGQHGSATIDLCSIGTLPAKPEEYKDLFEELVKIGYDDLKVYKRYQQGMINKRRKQINRVA